MAGWRHRGTFSFGMHGVDVSFLVKRILLLLFFGWMA
jgi:hypothetical protein